jgi:hypothetical protein
MPIEEKGAKEALDLIEVVELPNKNSWSGV